MYFMTMPREYWDDTWSEESEKKYDDARKSHQEAINTLEAHVRSGLVSNAQRKGGV